QGRTQFEAVPRSTADYPYVVGLRMPVDDEVTIGTVFVLANASFEKRCRPETRESPRQKCTGAGNAFRRRSSIAVRGIKKGTPSVVSYFEGAIVRARDSVNQPFSEINPDRQVRFLKSDIACGHSKEMHFLPAWLDVLAK